MREWGWHHFTLTTNTVGLQRATQQPQQRKEPLTSKPTPCTWQIHFHWDRTDSEPVQPPLPQKSHTGWTPRAPRLLTYRVSTCPLQFFSSGANRTRLWGFVFFLIFSYLLSFFYLFLILFFPLLSFLSWNQAHSFLLYCFYISFPFFLFWIRLLFPCNQTYSFLIVHLVFFHSFSFSLTFLDQAFFGSSFLGLGGVFSFFFLFLSRLTLTNKSKHT